VTQKLSNISLADLRRFLREQGCNHIGDKGGHEKWSRKDLIRPIVIQSHIDPVPEFIVKQILRTLDIDRSEFKL
jgi:hypothetical protein